MKKLTLILLLFYTVISFSQSEFQIEVELGYAFQNEIVLDNQNLENTNAFGVRFGINYLKVIKNNLYMETGLYGKYNRGVRKTDVIDFTFNNVKLQIPLYLGYKLDEKWKLSLGAGIENNKDFNEIDFKREHNLRYDFLTKLVYAYKGKLQYTFYSHWMMSNSPDIFTISSPKNGMYFGVIYQLGKNKIK